MVPHFGTRILLNFDCDSLQAITAILLFSIYFESMKWSIFCLKSLSGHSKKETQWLACEFLMRSAKAQDSRAQNTLSLSYSQQRVQREAKALANPERSGRSLQLASAKQCVPRNRDIFECPTDVKFSFKMHSLWIGVAQRQFPKAIPLVRSLQGCFPHWNVHEKKQEAPASNTSWAERTTIRFTIQVWMVLSNWCFISNVGSLGQWWSMESIAGVQSFHF